MKNTNGVINTRADLKEEVGKKLTDKHIAVYFAYLIRSLRHPSGEEPHRYLYMKDISKKEIGEQIGVSQSTIRMAEQKLIELGYMYFSFDRKIMYLPDNSVYSWIPVECLSVLLELSKNKECGGNIIRLYAALHYYKNTDQSFSAKTWVRALGLAETAQSNYIHVHVLLYVLKLYGFIDYDLQVSRAVGGKQYIRYEKVRVREPKELNNLDEKAAPVDAQVEQYKKIVSTGLEI